MAPFRCSLGKGGNNANHPQKLIYTLILSPPAEKVKKMY